MSRFFSARLHKSVADITRRKGRTLLIVLGIFTGVFGLTAINVTQDQLFAAFTFSVGYQTTRPDVILDVDRLDGSLLPALQAVPNVKTVQYETTLQTQWHVARAPGHVDFTITTYPDLRHIPLTPFELVSGRYPGAGEIVMEYGDSRCSTGRHWRSGHCGYRPGNRPAAGRGPGAHVRGEPSYHG